MRLILCTLLPLLWARQTNRVGYIMHYPSIVARKNHGGSKDKKNGVKNGISITKNVMKYYQFYEAGPSKTFGFLKKTYLIDSSFKFELEPKLALVRLNHSPKQTCLQLLLIKHTNTKDVKSKTDRREKQASLGEASIATDKYVKQLMCFFIGS